MPSKPRVKYSKVTPGDRAWIMGHTPTESAQILADVFGIRAPVRWLLARTFEEGPPYILTKQKTRRYLRCDLERWAERFLQN